jgi:hypothetical protein
MTSKATTWAKQMKEHPRNRRFHNPNNSCEHSAMLGFAPVELGGENPNHVSSTIALFHKSRTIALVWTTRRWREYSTNKADYAIHMPIFLGLLISALSTVDHKFRTMLALSR